MALTKKQTSFLNRLLVNSTKFAEATLDLHANGRTFDNREYTSVDSAALLADFELSPQDVLSAMTFIDELISFMAGTITGTSSTGWEIIDKVKE